jgi:hypothetical protein
MTIRLQRQEELLAEIKALVENFISRQPAPSEYRRTSPTSTLIQDECEPKCEYEEPETSYLSNPADRGTKSAPIVVMRQISQNLTSGYRRLLEHVNLDLVQLEMLDKETALSLVEQYVLPVFRIVIINTTAENC